MDENREGPYVLQPGAGAMAHFDQERARAIEDLRNATHGFLLTTLTQDKEDPEVISIGYSIHVNPNDRNQIDSKVLTEWYHFVVGRFSHMTRTLLSRSGE